MHNIRTHPFWFWYTLYTQTPLLTVKPINPPFYHFSDLFKPTLSKAWVAHYGQYAIFMCCDQKSFLSIQLKKLSVKNWWHWQQQIILFINSERQHKVGSGLGWWVFDDLQFCIHPTPDTKMFKIKFVHCVVHIHCQYKEQVYHSNYLSQKCTCAPVCGGVLALTWYTRFSHYRVAPGDRIRRPEQPNWKRG